MRLSVSRRWGSAYYVCERPACAHNSIIAQRVEDAVARILRFWFANPDQFQEQALVMFRADYQNLTEETESLERLIERKRAALRTWTADYEEALIDRPEYYAHRLRLESELARVQAVHAQNHFALSQADPAEILESLEGLLGRLSVHMQENWADPDTGHAVTVLLRRMGLQVLVRGERAEIRLRPIRWHPLKKLLDESEAE